MEKAIEIKRRAQRCILNGDLDGALNEYEKLIASGDSDPYHSVLLADLLYKKGDHEAAGRRYLEAVQGYEKVGLVKNAIAVCKKMSRLSLSPAEVLHRLASLHALDGLATESSLYYMQHAELVIGQGKREEAERSLRQAFQVCPDNVRGLERLAEVQEQGGAREAAAQTFIEAALQHERLDQLPEARRCRQRAEQLSPGAGQDTAAPGAAAAPDDNAAAAAPAEDAISHDAPPPLTPSPSPAATPLTPSRVTSSSPPRTSSPPASTPPTIDPSSATRPLSSSPPSFARSSTPPAPTPPPAPALSETESGSAQEPPETLEPVMPAALPPGLVSGAREITLDDEPAAVPVPDDSQNDASTPGNGVAATSSTPEPPGLAAEAAPDPVAAHDFAVEGGLPEVSVLLNEAQALFQRGEREAASATLVRAAQTYDRFGRFDSSASIYRSLSQVNEAPLQVMMLWLKNCQRRDDHREAARVACELGDRCLMDGDAAGAREWFERAHAYDGSNELAKRRLQRLKAAAPENQETVSATAAIAPPAPSPEPMEPEPQAVAPVASAAPATAPAAAPAEVSTAIHRPGHVELSLQTEEPVGVDLGQMIADFQKGLEEQLDSDPQGHYDLGMSYREMGLFEHAIESFRTAAQDEGFQVRASEMIGRCLLDQGDFDNAALQMEETLALAQLTPESSLDLRYQLGLAFEAGGRLEEALAQFERIYGAAANYPDVASKIRALRKMLEKD